MERERLTWRTSSHSGSNADCVEVAAVAHGTAVRDSKAPRAARLDFGRTAWTALLARVR